MSAFPLLTSPLDLGCLTLPNRVVMGSMHTGLEDRRGNFDRLAAYYAERARNGVGLIVTGGYAPNRQGSVELGRSAFAAVPVAVVAVGPVCDDAAARTAKAELSDSAQQRP